MSTAKRRGPRALGRTPLFRTIIRALHEAKLRGAHPDLEEGAGRLRTPSSRREFLGRSLQAAAALPFVARAAGAAQDRKDGPGSLQAPVAILGGGAAGLTAAYRLSRANVPCALFEGSDRLGGRIFTRRDFNKDGMFCELGAELVDSNHEELITLARELGLEVQELRDGDPGVDFYFFGGENRTDRDLIPAFEPLAKRLAEDAAGLEADDGSYTEKARRLDSISIEEYLDSRKNDVAKWVLELIRIAYVGEYGLEAGEQSALNLIADIDPDTTKGFRLFGDSDESKRIRGGNSTLTEALAGAIRDKVPIHVGHRLVRVRDFGNEIELTFEASRKSVSLRFNRVLFALPFTVLRQVEGMLDLDLSPAKKVCIRSLGYGTNVKVMYGFRERFWRRVEAGGHKSNGSIYCDLPGQCFWETSRGQGGLSGILTNFLGGLAGSTFHPKRFDETIVELDRMLPGVRGYFDGQKTMMNWPIFQFSKGSYSCPRVGQVTSILDAAGAPELGGRILFAGEHTSLDFGGFMNGAVQSGNRAAGEILAG